MTRREFSVALGAAPFAAAASPGKPELCIFSKHMAQFAPDELGRKAKEIGFTGVDLTVRPKGHVPPERATEELPRAVDAIRSHGLTLPMITTDIKSNADPNARPILSGAGKLKIPFWKPGYHHYPPGEDIEASIKKVRQAVLGLVDLSKEYGVTAGWHNHSGDYFGAAVWDTRAIIHDLDPKWIGYYFDPCHATIEGGLAGWRIAQNMVMPRLKMVALKDFYWEKGKDGRWKNTWCPMGEGMVDWERVFARFAEGKFTGPMTLHVEYHAKDELDAIARDLAFIKKRVAAAYGA
jgi:L-ribulose-5-phosphate 3-epimerase